MAILCPNVAITFRIISTALYLGDEGWDKLTDSHIRSKLEQNSNSTQFI